jgi:hypothetical protein
MLKVFYLAFILLPSTLKMSDEFTRNDLCSNNKKIHSNKVFYEVFISPIILAVNSMTFAYASSNFVFIFIKNKTLV